MTSIAFHTGVADKVDYACRLLRKASRQGFRVRVTGSAPDLDLLDRALWTFEPREFVAHARLPAGGQAVGALSPTPVWLCEPADAWPAGLAPAPVLVNLGPDPAPGVADHERVVEIVCTDDADRRSGRQRWRAYEAMGLAPRHVPVGAA